MLKIRLARGGSKKRPHYSIVVANSRSPRDGKFIEKIGRYNPMVAKDHPERLVLNTERVKYWLGVGAEATDRVGRFLGQQGLAPMPKIYSDPIKSAPKKKAQERMAAEAEKLAAAEEAKKAAEAEAAAATAPAPEPVAETSVEQESAAVAEEPQPSTEG